MKNIRNDLTGKVFGRLEVLKVDESKKTRKTYWLCKCDCGNVKSVRSDSLGRTLSCGCLKKEQDFMNLNLENKQMHGKTQHPLYPRWVAMINRCENPKAERYKNYGGRGIKVCTEWKTFENFYNWAINNGFDKSLTIERIDLNGNYEPNNCKWITANEQYFNKTTNVWHTYNGETLTTMQWQRKLNIPIYLIKTYKSKNIDFLTIIEKYYKGNPVVTS